VGYRAIIVQQGLFGHQRHKISRREDDDEIGAVGVSLAQIRRKQSDGRTSLHKITVSRTELAPVPTMRGKLWYPASSSAFLTVRTVRDLS